ncbi:hypothetical protein LJC24_02240 [Desulfococcaceae bacterium OttesenSCG-928-F15]|nr:hypothetical protein [Desulfococcaceae bacterium OttesenSCG-928-F15]
MEFLPVKPSVLNVLVWIAIILLFMGGKAGLATETGATYFLGGILLGFPAYFAHILWIEGFGRGKH